MIRYSVRINLAEFIDKPEEEDIIGAIHAIGEQTGKKIFLKLWYNKEFIAQERIVEFVKKYGKVLEDIGTNIHVGDHEAWQQKSWFNLRKRGYPAFSDYRHEYIYDSMSDLLRGIVVFGVMVQKIDNNQVVNNPPQSPKRENGGQHGYRVSIRKVSNGIQEQSLPEREKKNENRNSRFPQVDRQTKDS